VAFQVWLLLALVLDAIAIAGQAIIGSMLGAGDASGALQAARRMIAWSVVAGVVFGLASAAVSPILASLFSSDPAVRHAIGRVMIVVALMQPLNAIVFVLDGVLIGAGDARALALAMVASAVVFVPIALLVLAKGTLVWLWVGIGAFMGARLIGVGARFRTGRWARTGMAS